MRTEGWPSVPTVATAIASGSLGSDARASAYQLPNRGRGSVIFTFSNYRRGRLGAFGIERAGNTVEREAELRTIRGHAKA